MSLDVYLSDGVERESRQKIYIRRYGKTTEITREEWDELYPQRQPVSVEVCDELYSANITHNLGVMAREAGIYQHLWRPEEIDITHAGQLVEPLRNGLALLESDAERFKKLNPQNGWGTYEGLVEFVRNYLKACEENEGAAVSVSR